jgi:hypothetical protein
MRRTRVKSSNPARKAANLTRAHGSPEFREWIKQRPCVACGRTPSDAAHLKSGGTGRKDDVTGVVPLCSDFPGDGCMVYGCHSRYDGRAPGWGKKTFRAYHAHVDLEHEARRIEELWAGLGRQSALTPIGDILRARPWQCTAKRSHGPCNTVNDAEDESCGACGNDAPARARSDEGAA